jgi:1,4-alpha-glucan branching enzyme
LEWEYLDRPDHAGVSCLIEDLNRLYRNENPLWEADHNTGGFLWIAANRAEENLVAFLRISPTKGEQICCISNFSRKAKKGVRLGLPVAGKYEEILNTDQEKYGGKESHRGGEVVAESVPQDELPFSGRFDLPPLTTVWYRVPWTYSGIFRYTFLYGG